MSELQQQIPQDVEVVEAEKKKKLSLKKNVDQADFGGPKRAKTGFMLFGDDKRAEGINDSIKADCEKKGEAFTVVAVMKRIGELWKAASEETKAPYNARSKEASAKYHADMEAWKLTKEYKKYVHAQAAHSKKKDDQKNKLAAKESGMPKKAMAGYMTFAQDVREEVRKEMEAKGEKYNIAAAAGYVKVKWAATGDEAKQKYQEAYEVAKKKYEEDMAAWLQTEGGQAFTAAKGKAVQKRDNNSRVGPKAKRAKKASTATGEEAEAEQADESLELSSPDEDAEQAEAVVEEVVEN